MYYCPIILVPLAYNFVLSVIVLTGTNRLISALIPNVTVYNFAAYIIHINLSALLYRVPLDSKGKNIVIFISRICLLNLEANAFRR